MTDQIVFRLHVADNWTGYVQRAEDPHTLPNISNSFLLNSYSACAAQWGRSCHQQLGQCHL